jgi:ATP-binding cassette subfamily B protein
MGRERTALRVQPRSVVTGRQRWDIDVVLGRPRVAELLEAELRKSLGVGPIRANPVTGRLLIYHDVALSREEVDQLVREAVALAVRQDRALTRSSRPEPEVMLARVRQRHHTTPSFTIAGSAVIGIAALGGYLLRSPLVRLGVVLVATVGVVRRAWRKSRSRQQTSTMPLSASRRPILQIVGSHKRELYLASVISILVQILEMVPALLIGWMIVVLLNGKMVALRLGLATASSQLGFLAGMVTFVCVVFIVAAALSFTAGTLWRNLAQSVQHDWRTEIYAHVQKVKLPFLESERTTRIATVLTDDINQLGRFLATTWPNDFLQLCTSFVVLISMFLFFAPSIAWVVLLPVPIIVSLSLFYQEHTAPLYKINSANWSLLNSQLLNNLEASATVKSFCTEQYEIDRIRRLSEAYRQSNRWIDTRAAAYSPIVRLCAVTSVVGILLLGGHAALAGALPFAVFNFLAAGLPQRVLFQLPRLGDALDQYQHTAAALGRMLDLLRLPVEPGDTGRRLDVAKVRGEVVFDGVTFAYHGHPPLFQNFSLRIASKKTTGIVGGTGAGKTTIAKLMLRFHDVTSGRVLLDGLDIRDLSLQDLRNTIGFVAQDAFLIDGTVDDNIRYGRFDADAEQVVNAARLAKADRFVEALPSQYDTMVGERGVTLSGGQKQRLSLARTILKSAPIIILDEATSAVDNETEAAIQRALRDFARDRTMVIIAHRLSTIRHADWIYVIEQGGVVAEEGTHHQLLEREGIYASLWNLQSGEATA